MSAVFAVTTAIEIAIVLLLILGFMNEKKVIAFEDKLAVIIAGIILAFRRKTSAKRAAEKPCKTGQVCTYKNSGKYSSSRAA